jgi:effector-binding domain-containing protein
MRGRTIAAALERLSPSLAAVVLAASVARCETPEAAKVLDAMDLARGNASAEAVPHTLVMSGSFTLAVGGSASDEPMKGTVEMAFDGRRIHEISDYGGFGTVERGYDGEVMWEIHAAMGTRIFKGADATQMLRLFAFHRWPGWRALYKEAAVIGNEMRGGRPHLLLRMTPHDGKTEVWFIDQETHLPARLDFTVTWNEKEYGAQYEIEEWQRVKGRLYSRREKLTAANAIGSYVYDSVLPGERVDPERFALPKEVVETLAAETAAAPKRKVTAQIQTREPEPVATIRVRGPRREVPKALAEILPEVMAYLSEAGVETRGAPFCRYHSESDALVDLEAGFPVAKPVASRGRIQASELPGGRVAMMFHFGDYEKLGEMRALLRGWLEGQRLAPRGGPWEVYWTDPELQPDKSQWHAQIFWPVE